MKRKEKVIAFGVLFLFAGAGAVVGFYKRAKPVPREITVQKSSYAGPVETIAFKVEGITQKKGMVCMGCVDKVKKALFSVPHVVGAHISLDNQSAVVQCEKGKVKPEALQSAVRKAGFKAILEPSTS